MGGRQEDRVFAALERLESKETQHAAYEELQRLIREMDAANLSTLIHAAGATTAKTTTFSRVHSLRLVALSTQQACCPSGWRAMLAPPLLPKLLGLLGRALHDADSAVRVAAADGFGVVAAQLAAANPGGCELTAGNPSNPLLACILEALGEPSGAVQAAAASALAAAADHLRPGLEPALLGQLLRALSNPLFLGRADMCAAIARLEEGRVHGLLASSCQQLLEAMPELMGSQEEGKGLLGVLTGKGKDFQSRAAAAHTLKALAVGLGPLWAAGGGGGSWEAAAAALKSAKTDISKPVRDAALASLPLVAGLVEFMASGAPAAAWPEACGSLLAASAGAGGRSKRSGSVVGTGVKPKAAVAGDGMLGRLDGQAPAGQCIPAVWQQGQQPAGPPPLVPGQPMLPLPVGGYGASPLPPVVVSPLLPGAAPFGSGPAPALVYAPPAGPAAVAGMLGAPAVPTAVPPQLPAGNQLAAQLAAIQDQQARMAAALSAFTASTQGTLDQLQQHLASVSAGMAALSVATPSGPSGAPSGGPPQQQQLLQQQQQQQETLLQERLASMRASMAALAAGVNGAQQMQKHLAGPAAGSGGQPAAVSETSDGTQRARRASQRPAQQAPPQQPQLAQQPQLLPPQPQVQAPVQVRAQQPAQLVQQPAPSLPAQQVQQPVQPLKPQPQVPLPSPRQQQAPVPVPAAPQPAGTAPPDQPPSGHRKRLSSLRRSYDVLEQQLQQQGRDSASPHTTAAAAAAAAQGAALAGKPAVGAAATRGRAGSVPAVLPSAASAGAAAPAGPASPSSPASLDGMYALVLSSSGGEGSALRLAGDQQAQLRVLRAMAKSGPVWEHLAPATGQLLMGAITGLLQEGIALKRLLPWLWPLADAGSPAAAAAASFPLHMRQQLLAALAAYPLSGAASGSGQPQDGLAEKGGGKSYAGSTASAAARAAPAVSMGEKRDLLLSALRAVWDATAPAGQQPSHGQPHDSSQACCFGGFGL